jgi:hypothetical protein
MVSGFLDRIANWLSAPDDVSATQPPAPAPSNLAISPDDERLPDASRPRVAQLVSLIADIEARARDNSLMVSALASYAEIPPAHRAEIFRTTGRSASYNLNEALDRMVTRAETLSRLMAQDDIDSFADNLRFIEQRYGDNGPA